MRYTVNKLAKISGISPRTLRFYDAINLLKPACYGENHYRYYEKEQLLILQQILFFRELAFPLAEIQRIISSNDFDKIETLQKHKMLLQSSLEKTETLIKTIDKTISYLGGKSIMKDTEMYEGFNPEKQREHEAWMLEKGILSEKEIAASWDKARDWKKSDWEKFKEEGEQLNQKLAEVMRTHLEPDNREVQVLIQGHYNWVKNFWTPTKESYSRLAEMYLEHPDYRDFYNRYHPGLAEYVVLAMQVFSEHKLS